MCLNKSRVCKRSLKCIFFRVLQVNITSLLIHFPLAYFQFGRTSHTKIPHRGLLPHLPPNISALCVQRRSGMRTNWRNITEYTPGRNHTSVKNVIDGLTWKVTWGLISEVVNKTEDKLIGFFWRWTFAQKFKKIHTHLYLIATKNFWKNALVEYIDNTI